MITERTLRIDSSDMLAPIVLEKANTNEPDLKMAVQTVKRSPGRSAKIRHCIDPSLAADLNEIGPYDTKLVCVCTVLDNTTSWASNCELYREIELITLLDGYDLPEGEDYVPLATHHWKNPMSRTDWQDMYETLFPIYARVGEYIGLDLDTLCKRHRIAGERHYTLRLPQSKNQDWKAGLGITAYIEAELSKQQIHRIAMDKRVRIIQGLASYE